MVNRSGTLPSSFKGYVHGTDEAIEIRLAAFRGADVSDLSHWAAVSFGDGDWHLPTERRGPAPRLKVGDEVRIAPGLSAKILRVDPQFYRLIHIEFQSPSLVKALYASGRPIQYSYLREELRVWDQQTIFSGPPLSVEPPSAGFPFHWKQILDLKSQGVEIASVLHGAGLSSTGDPALDSRFPLDEYFDVPFDTTKLIERTHRNGHRVVALGTSAARALESSLRQAAGYTDLKLGPHSSLRLVDALITGMHEPGTTHADLMQAFCKAEVLTKAVREAEWLGYRSHEFGDLTFILRS